MGEQRYADALELIYQRNALPAITGHICDHQCQYNCTRLDYDSALNIRELKKSPLRKAGMNTSSAGINPQVPAPDIR